MLRFVIGTFIILHGLVHLWYFTLSQKLVAFQPDMGWSGESWAFTRLVGDPTTRTAASILYVLVTIGFAAGGIGIYLQQDWWRPVIMGSAIISSAIIFLFWDGGFNLLVQKGLLGLLINIAILIAMAVIAAPAVTQ